MSHVPTIRARHLAWLPAALLISAGVLSAVGVSLTPNGRAATATGTTNISATVLPEISLDLAQNLAGASTCGTYVSGTGGTNGNEVYTFGTGGARIPINASGATALGTCNMTFGTNNHTAGVTLSYTSARSGNANRTFCTAAAAADCTGAFTYYQDDDGANATLEADKFGMLMEAASACETQTLVDNRYYGAPLSGSPANVCTAESASATPANDGFVQVSFHVNTSAVASGDYNASLVFTATSL